MTGRRPRIAGAAAALAVSAGVWSACGPEVDPDTSPDDRATTTIARVFAPDGSTRLWLSSPDDDQVVEVEPATLAVRSSVGVCAQPYAVATTVAGPLVVTAELDTCVSIVDPRTEVAVARLEVPCGGTRGAVAIDDALVAVTCPNDGRVVVVDVVAAAVRSVWGAPGRPVSVAVASGDVVVVDAGAGQVLAAPIAGLLRRRGTPAAPSPVDWQLRPLTAGGGRAASQADAIAIVDGRPAVAYQAVDADTDRDRPPELGGYGRVVDDAPRIEPMLGGACEGAYARYDGRERVFAGPSALAFDGDHLWAVNTYTGNVAVLQCEVGRSLPLYASFRVGDGARGIALSDDGGTAWVDVGFDHAVSRLELGAAGVFEVMPAATVARAVSPTRLSPSGEAGRRLFFDATNPQLTPAGVVACATCHPGAGDDGLVWFLHTESVPRKLRRTPPAWQHGDAALLHWDGAYDSAATLFTDTVRALMGGQALGIDATAVTAFLAETPPPPPRPASAVDAAAVARGAALFTREDVACASCHIDGYGADPELHAVVPETDDDDASIGPARTPSLAGVRARPPYLHDGRARSLEEVLTTHNRGDTHGRTSQLHQRDVDDLVEYMETL
ncbi:MAG: c-type cytochrome [Myxococcales bacterium]|nr:c-type cytochrome [Myxococcales bacterium]